MSMSTIRAGNICQGEGPRLNTRSDVRNLQKVLSHLQEDKMGKEGMKEEREGIQKKYR